MILLDPRDHRPIYEQIIEKMSELLAMGALPQDEPLPSVRALAAELSINPNTVQRAYVELERRGFIYSIKGKGNFAADPEQIRAARMEDVGAELDAALRKAAAHGMREDEVLSRVHLIYSAASAAGQGRNTASGTGQGGNAATGTEKGGKEAFAVGTGREAQMTGGGKNDDSDN